MKNIVIFVVLGVGAWTLYEQQFVSPVIEMTGSSTMYGSSSLQSGRFRCDGREYCSKMTSREEAVFFINNCPNTKMDGDRDGIPCENDSRF
tara:strand:- start:1945 stop:2217 length:273 start_codon:yes stop_codon:yes gene_type:complete